MIIILFLLMQSLCILAGEPVAIVAQKNFRIKNLRELLTNNAQSSSHNKGCWIALGLTTGALATSAAFVVRALSIYENTELERNLAEKI